MTSLREAVRRRHRRHPTAPTPDPAMSYRFFWMAQARLWPAPRRQAVLQAVRAVVEAPDFVPNPYQRLYQVVGLDPTGQAGASLVALREVLQALQASDNTTA